MCFSRRLNSVTLLLCLALWVTLDASASANQKWRRRANASARAAQQRRTQQMIKAAEQELAAARRMQELAKFEAREASSRLDKQKNRIVDARSAEESARREVQQLRALLRRIESDILSTQGADSGYARARAAQDEAREEFRRVEQRVQATPEYQTRTAEVQVSGDPLLIAEVRSQLFEADPAYILARGKLETAVRAVDLARFDLLQQSPEWKATAEELRAAEADQVEALEEATRAGLQSLPAKRQLRIAKEAQAAAEARIQQGEAIVRQLQPRRSSGSGKPQARDYRTPSKAKR